MSHKIHHIFKFIIIHCIFSIAFIWHKNMLELFVLGHYMFLKAQSFPWTMLSENCTPLKQISPDKINIWAFLFIVIVSFCACRHIS